MSQAAESRKDLLRECLEEAIGRDLAAGVTRTALRLASLDETPTDPFALRKYLEGPLAEAVAEALGRDAAVALVHIVQARLLPGTLPPPGKTTPEKPTRTLVSERRPADPPADEGARAHSPRGVTTPTSMIRRSRKRTAVVLRCADALRRAEAARSLVQAHCDVIIVSGIDDVAALGRGKAPVDLAILETSEPDALAILRTLSDALHVPVIAWADAGDERAATRMLRDLGVGRFIVLPKSASSRELLESVVELLLGVVPSP